LDLPMGIETYENAIIFLKKLENDIIFSKKIHELFSIDDFSVWWFIYPSIFSSIQTWTNFISKFEITLIKNNITEIELVGEFEKYNIIKQICKKNKIHLHSSKYNEINLKLKKSIINKIQRTRYKKITKNKIADRIKIFEKKSNLIPNFKNKIIFAISTYYRSSVYNFEKNQTLSGEYIQGKIISILQKFNSQIVGFDIDYTFRGQPEILETRLNDTFPWLPLEIILTSKLTSNQSTFLKKYSDILKSLQFQECFKINKISFWNEIKFDFEKLTFSPHIPFYFQIINSLTKIFANNKPKSIFIPYETGPIALSILIACYRNNIKTFGIQHGLIYKNNSDYMHNNFRNFSNLNGFPLPDTLLLFGKYTLELLKSQNYPEKNLTVLGNIEFFDVNKIHNTLSIKKIITKYSLPTNKKIILFATSRIQNFYRGVGGDHDERVLKSLLNSFGNSDEYLIILKPHPSEFIETYSKIISSYNVNNFKIIQGNLFELIFVSNLVISIFSTVLVDSIALKKSTLRIKFEGSSPLIPYQNYNVLLECELNQLYNKINEFFNQDEEKNILNKNRDIFLKEHYNIPNYDVDSQLKSLLD